MRTIWRFSHIVLLLTASEPLVAQTNTFPGSGSVGIGTTSPSATLEVNGTALVDSTATFAVAGYALFHTAKDGGATGGIVAESGKGLYLAANNSLSTGLFIDANGNVGFGTSSPSVNLAIRGNSGFASGDAYIRLTSASIPDTTSRGVFIASAEGATANARFGTFEPNGGVFLRAGGVDTLNITPAGYVGIGTTSPSGRLSVYGTNVNSYFQHNADQAVYFDSSASDPATAGAPLKDSVGMLLKGSYWNGASASSVLYGGVMGRPSDAAGNGYLALQSPWGSDRVVVTTAGNVGIGTTNPTQKLSVNGTIQAKEIFVQTGWSDYVFKADYKLASLSEVERAIKRDGHLPGIPSAQEVAEHGVSMGEMQSKLLAKIEEITLHQIEQEKRLAAQQIEIAALRNQLGGISPK